MTPSLVVGLLLFLDGWNTLPEFLLSESGTQLHDFLQSELLGTILRTIALIGVLAGCIFVACSREAVEDELTITLRLNALLLAFYINSALLIVMTLCIYDLDYIDVMIYNLFTLPVLFVIIFRTKIFRFRKECDHEE